MGNMIIKPANKDVVRQKIIAASKVVDKFPGGRRQRNPDPFYVFIPEGHLYKLRWSAPDLVRKRQDDWEAEVVTPEVAKNVYKISDTEIKGGKVIRRGNILIRFTLEAYQAMKAKRLLGLNKSFSQDLRSLQKAVEASAKRERDEGDRSGDAGLHITEADTNFDVTDLKVSTKDVEKVEQERRERAERDKAVFLAAVAAKDAKKAERAAGPNLPRPRARRSNPEEEALLDVAAAHGAAIGLTDVPEDTDFPDGDED